MKRLVLITALSISFVHAIAQIDSAIQNFEQLEQKVSLLQAKQNLQNLEIEILIKNDIKKSTQLKNLQSTDDSLRFKLDSLQTEYDILVDLQKADKDSLTAQLGQTKKEVQANNEAISTRTVWWIVCLLVLFAIISIIVWRFRNKFKHGSESIDEIWKAQRALVEVQKSLLEESVKLDNKLIEVVDKQLILSSTTIPDAKTATEADHSLVLIFADEIIRIETNLLRMDSSIRGYKQLFKAVERIKNNFSANGYEIVDMLGKPYVEGMRSVVTFITDETLEAGQQIITKIIKPQVNYKQEMIQAAQIEVSQSE